MDKFRYDVFISYRRADGQRFANHLRQALIRANRRLPVPRPPLRVYLDRVYARATEDFYRDEISPALVNARWLLVLATPAAAERQGSADWVAREIGDFEAARGLSSIRILHARGRDLPRLPHGIQDRMPNAQQIDLRGLGAVLPGAAQTRDDWLALLATLFDLSPEDMPALRRIEETSRRNRLALAAGALAGAVAFATGVSAFALYRDAETRRLVELSAATLGLAIADDPSQNALTCDALGELWASGAQRRARPSIHCRIAAAYEAFETADEDPQAALAVLGKWDQALALLPPETSETGDEMRLARHDFELDRQQYLAFAASGDWLGADPVPPAALPAFVQAVEVCLSTLTDLPGAPSARADLGGLIWKVTAALEQDARPGDSLDLMIRAADALEPGAKADLEGLGDMDPEFPEWAAAVDRIVDYATLRRRAGFYLLHDRKDAPAALAATDAALAMLRPLDSAHPWGAYQTALAYLVRGQARTATEDATGAATDYGLALFWAGRALADPDIDPSLWRDVAALEQELIGLGAVAATGPETP